jgi:hypothetical protein
MCQQLTILARDDAAHSIAQCEHGTVHVFWVRAALFLHPDDLLPLLALLQCWQPAHEVTQSDGFTIVRQVSGQLQLWCDEIGLLMSEADLYSLAQLLWRAADRLNLLAGSRQAPAPNTLAAYRRLTSVPRRANSQN